jgi:hypothetical protein
MKANDFIKKHGIEQAKSHAKLLQEIQINGNHQEYIDDLKNLIASHNLVSKVGGLKRAKLRATNKFKPVGKNLLKAIADVESCQ